MLSLIALFVCLFFLQFLQIVRFYICIHLLVSVSCSIAEFVNVIIYKVDLEGLWLFIDYGSVSQSYEAKAHR